MFRQIGYGDDVQNVLEFVPEFDFFDFVDVAVYLPKVFGYGLAYCLFFFFRQCGEEGVELLLCLFPFFSFGFQPLLFEFEVLLFCFHIVFFLSFKFDEEIPEGSRPSRHFFYQVLIFFSSSLRDSISASSTDFL